MVPQPHYSKKNMKKKKDNTAKLCRLFAPQKTDESKAPVILYKLHQCSPQLTDESRVQGPHSLPVAEDACGCLHRAVLKHGNEQSVCVSTTPTLTPSPHDPWGQLMYRDADDKIWKIPLRTMALSPSPPHAPHVAVRRCPRYPPPPPEHKRVIHDPARSTASWQSPARGGASPSCPQPERSPESPSPPPRDVCWSATATPALDPRPRCGR